MIIRRFKATDSLPVVNSPGAYWFKKGDIFYENPFIQPAPHGKQSGEHIIYLSTEGMITEDNSTGLPYDMIE